MRTESIQISYNVCELNELEHADRLLIEAAKTAAKGSYSPYSKLSVGAAVLLENNQVVCGSNQENAAYPSGICAERTALFYANSNYPHQPVTVLAIAALTNGEYLPYPLSPCGSCRQVISEIERRFGKPIKVILYGTERIIVIDKGSALLLPLSFGPDCLPESKKTEKLPPCHL